MGHSSLACPESPKVVQGEVRWSVRIEGQVVAWDWSGGSPDPRRLGSVRTPRSTAKSRHAPVHSHSVTTGTAIHVESGLEHDLLLDLDRRASVVWLVAQPCRLSFVSSRTRRRRTHVPDMLSLASSGEVTLWDVRPAERRDDKFDDAARSTEIAATERGWRYEVFGGFSPVRTYNLRWLAAYRRVEPWHDACVDELRRAITQPGCTIGAVMDLDGGAGHVMSTMWHLMWSGLVEAELDEALARRTTVCWVRPTEVEGS